MDWAIVAIILAEFGLLALVIWLVAVRLRDRARWRFELQARLLDRFSSPVELQQFLESDVGRRLLQSLSPRRSPDRPALFSIQAGVVVSALGLAVLLSALFHLGGAHLGPELTITGAVVLAVGIGLLVAGAVSHRLGRAWGLTGSGPSVLGNDAASKA